MSDLRVQCERCGLQIDHRCGKGIPEAARRLMTTVAFVPGLGNEERRKLQIDIDSLLRTLGVAPGPLWDALEAEWIYDMAGKGGVVG